MVLYHADWSSRVDDAADSALGAAPFVLPFPGAESASASRASNSFCAFSMF